MSERSGLQKLYGRRKGKKLRSRQDGLVADLLPRVALGIAGGTIDPVELFGGKQSGIRVEIGFGDGARLIEQATQNPGVGYIGCEPFLNGVAKALAAIDERRLTNLRVHHGDGRDVLEALPSESVDLIELLYPDPWPKRRHRKRRIISEAFLAQSARVLKRAGALRFATDIDDYCGWALARVLRSNEFSWTAESAADWQVPWEGWRPTRYEQKARREGRTSSYLTFVRN
ncbi:MAG: tRNA (guanosine(46)-N7)-methyltransferase TrmB [Hyphomicrobiales bacterium]|nr:tRNA (guanosine(46)-N7)-methyltransferase TrmB [Hyphomicrobiales bacterium]